MKKFLIINPFGIGDVLFTTPVIGNIKENYPDCVIGYWCNQRVAEILKNNPCIDKIYPLSRGDIKKISRQSRLKGLSMSWGLYRHLKEERFDVALDYSLDHRYGLICKIIGIKKRIGFNYKKRGRFLTDKIGLESYSEKHVVEYYLDLLKVLGITPSVFDMSLKVTQAEKSGAAGLLSTYGIKSGDLVVGIAPGAGASWGGDASLKHWPATNFARLADRIASTYSAKIVILGDALEHPIADEIISKMHNKAIDLTGKTNLGELPAFIDAVDVLISNDGGPLHIACALGKKTLSFFGPVDPKVYGPYPADKARHIILSKSLDCSPCYRNFRLNACQANKACLEMIDVDEAYTVVESLLN